MGRAHQELSAAELLAQNEYFAQAVSRSYFAAFYAAEEALLAVGVVRSKHSGVVAAVSQVLIRDLDLDEMSGRLLRSLFERRSQADYASDEVPAEEARSAIADARVVVVSIEDWLRERQR